MKRLSGPIGGAVRQDVLAAPELDVDSIEGDYAALAAGHNAETKFGSEGRGGGKHEKYGQSARARQDPKRQSSENWEGGIGVIRVMASALCCRSVRSVFL